MDNTKRLSRKGKKVKIKASASDTLLDDSSDAQVMATSFLQFCTTCEKQIFTPSNSILYCSEACRRKDSSKPLSDAQMPNPSNTPPSPSITRPILPPRIPTGASTSSRSSRHSDRGSKTDLDPTEWKPKLARQAWSPNTGSEAFLYLSRFHQSNPSLRNHASPHMLRSQSTTNMGTEIGQTTRTVSSTSLNTHATSLTLSRTPTTAASSLSGSVDLTIHSTAYTYDFNTRPLPPRRDPSLSSTGRGVGVDLVVPYAPPKVEGKNMDGGSGFCGVGGGFGAVEMGGLGKLLKGD